MAEKKVKRWEDDKVTIKIVNIESPGADIVVGVNGKNFIMQHEATCRVHRAVLGVLKNATITNVEVKGDLEKGNTVKKKSISERFFVVELEDAPEKKETVLDGLANNVDID